MNYIEKSATEFARIVLYNISKYEEIVKKSKDKINNIDNKKDKIKFLSILLEQNKIKYEMHLKECTDKENCPDNIGHESVRYYLTQELNRLGVDTDEDMFTSKEKETYENKLDQILEEIELLKASQRFIYDEVMTEINELKDFYYLGKKNWMHLFVGKLVDMTASGIISETLSKKIIVDFKKELPNFLF